MFGFGGVEGCSERCQRVPHVEGKLVVSQLQETRAELGRAGPGLCFSGVGLGLFLFLN